MPAQKKPVIIHIIRKKKCNNFLWNQFGVYLCYMLYGSHTEVVGKYCKTGHVTVVEAKVRGEMF